jgi:transposase
MAIVVGLDVHRAQITYDALDTASGEVTTGRIAPSDRATLRRFLDRWAGEEVAAAVEAMTGWRFRRRGVPRRVRRLRGHWG